MARLRVLIVDDEPGICSGISRILSGYTVNFPFLEEEFEYEVREVGTGEEALEIINKEGADIVLLDNKLPGIYGIDVLEHINKKQIDCSVMMITSYASLDLAVQATNNGAYNFVPKPFTPRELKSAIESITKHLYLKRMTRNLKSEDKQVRNKFMSLLSHELKLPLSAIEGYLKIMKDHMAGDKIEDYDDMVNRSLERIKGMRLLIADLLDMTRVESGNEKNKFKKINLTDIAFISKDIISPISAQKNVNITINSEPKQVFFNGDGDKLEIVFNNLISNAVKYNKDDGEVKCILRDLPEKVVIIVEDTGIGISEEDIPKLFQEFVRIKNEETKQISGNGLGLSIIKKIVEDTYRGKISVLSVPGEGTVFTVELPKSYSEDSDN